MSGGQVLRRAGRIKSVEQALADTDAPGSQLRRHLRWWELAMMGVGVIVGTGIFVTTGEVAGTMAGPAVAVSFIVAAVACGLAALCYAEFASSIPVAGSAYTFAYSSIGELVAWLIGWNILLELVVGAAAVSTGWSAYFVDVLNKTLGLTLPDWLYGPMDAAHPNGLQHNIIAALIVLVLTGVLCLGIEASARFNNVMVVIKVAVVLLVIVAGLFFVKAANLSPFVPPSGSAPAPDAPPAAGSLLQDLGIAPGAFGVMGIFSGAAIVFFAFLGFDILSTTAEETKNPQRDMPRGIIAALAICTTLYVAVCLVLCAMVKYDRMNIAAPLSAAFRAVGQDWIATVISIGSVVGLTTVVMIMILGQSRILFAMSRDGLLPAYFRRVNARTGAPVRITLLTGFVVAVLALFIPLGDLVQLVNIGTLFAFIVVAIAVPVLRKRRPDVHRAFRCPGVPWLPIASVVVSGYLMLNLPSATWIRFLVWSLLGIVVYFLYGQRGANRAFAERAERTWVDSAEDAFTR